MASLDDLVTWSADRPTVAYGLTPPFAARAAASLAARCAPGELLVVVVADEAAAQRMASDIEFFLPRAEQNDDPAAPPRVLQIPALDSSPYAELSPDRQALMRRMAALFRLAQGQSLLGPVVVASASALLRRVIPRAELDLLTDIVLAEQNVDRDATVEFLLRAGYSRAPLVEDPGTFAVRGGVLDVFPPLYGFPVRIELFGDRVESMRFFDPETQRTLRDISELYLHPVRETVPTRGADPRRRILAAADAAAHPSTSTRRVLELVERGEEFVGIETLTPAFHQALAPMWSYFPDAPRTGWLICDPDSVVGAADDELGVAEQRYAQRLEDHRIAFPPDAHYLATDELRAGLAAPTRRIEARGLELLEDAASPSDPESAPTVLRFTVEDNRSLRAELERARRQRAEELLRPLASALETWRAEGWRVGIACESASRGERLSALLAEYGVDLRAAADARIDLEALEPGAPPAILRGALSAGFAAPTERLALLTADEIFGERRRASAAQLRAAKRARKALLGGVADFSQLEAGDYLVHDLHGVGLYQGLAKLPLGGTPIDFLHLEYQGGTLYLPVYRLNEVQRYVGAEGHKPRLDRLGGVTWEKARKKATREVRKLAEDLLQLYAQRAALPGHAFPPPDALFREFEATFEFEETPDQQRAIDEVLANMEAPRPMDRLVCGDVGYGKTEIALRATLEAVLGGKQSAMLAPTTVLVEQHYQTMVERFSGWPIRVAKLSRFQPRKQQLETIKALADGSVDAVVGTHRLLSKDVRFKDLGLIVIDEEQRFGVAHKERLKRMRTQVDVLTLTATPIPRTLHLAMTGLRDLSIIATPPADRRSIRTFVARADDGVLREGIRRELGRGGQVFFVCPRIGTKRGARDRSLEEWASHLAALVPEARVAVAHGQLSSEALERVMVGFVGGSFDILVSTTIIENGLDIPRANTMFIARADSFGLSQLYQLRGRIGRAKQRAFCYLLVPPPEKLSHDARRRLEALQRFTHLGAGFQIASHDLEIRGAGELLGARQSGTIAAVGFEAYTRMLEEAVAELRNEPIQRPRDPELNVDVPGFIPDDYVPDTGQRLDLYKRLASAEDDDEVGQLMEEMGDRYGPPPLEVALLADLSVLRAHARRLRAVSVDLNASRLCLALAEDTPLSPQKVLDLVNRPNSAYQLTPDMRLSRAFSSDERKQPTRAARLCLLDLLACAT